MRISDPRAQLHEIILKNSALLDVLDERERRLIYVFVGLPDKVPKSLRQTGATLRITGERVRQLVNIALAKMRAASGDSN